MDPVRIVENLDQEPDLNEGDPFEILECVPAAYPIKRRRDTEAAGRDI